MTFQFQKTPSTIWRSWTPDTLGFPLDFPLAERNGSMPRQWRSWVLNGGTMTRSSRDLTATRPWCVFFLFGPLLDRVHYNNQGWFGGYIYIYNIYIYCNTTVGRWDYKPTNITRGPHFVGGGSGGVQAFPKGYHVSWPRWMGIWVGRVVYSMPGNMMVHPSWQA